MFDGWNSEMRDGLTRQGVTYDVLPTRPITSRTPDMIRLAHALAKKTFPFDALNFPIVSFGLQDKTLSQCLSIDHSSCDDFGDPVCATCVGNFFGVFLKIPS